MKHFVFFAAMAVVCDFLWAGSRRLMAFLLAPLLRVAMVTGVVLMVLTPTVTQAAPEATPVALIGEEQAAAKLEALEAHTRALRANAAASRKLATETAARAERETRELVLTERLAEAQEAGNRLQAELLAVTNELKVAQAEAEASRREAANATQGFTEAQQSGNRLQTELLEATRIQTRDLRLLGGGILLVLLANLLLRRRGKARLENEFREFRQAHEAAQAERERAAAEARVEAQTASTQPILGRLDALAKLVAEMAEVTHQQLRGITQRETVRDTWLRELGRRVVGLGQGVQGLFEHQKGRDALLRLQGQVLEALVRPLEEVRRFVGDQSHYMGQPNNGSWGALLRLLQDPGEAIQLADGPPRFRGDPPTSGGEARPT